MSTHAVSVRRVVQHTIASEPGEGERLLPGSPVPVVTYATIQLVSSDGLIHVRLNGTGAEGYTAGAEYDITITPRV